MNDYTYLAQVKHKEYARKSADASHQTAKFFVTHLKKLIANSSDPFSLSIQLSKKDLYKDFVYPSIAKEAWLRYDKKNYSESEEAHWRAYKEGFIKIDGKCFILKGK